MTKLEEWMLKFLSSNDSFSNSFQKEEAVKAFTDIDSWERDELNLNVEQLKDLCRRIDDYITQSRPGFSQDPSQKLDAFFVKLLEFVTNLARVNAQAHNFMRDDTSLIATLTWYLNNKYRKEDEVKILRTIEVLSKGLVITWSIPYLNQLVKQTYAIILNPGTSFEACLYCLRIITNMVSLNPSCLNIVIRDVNYKFVLKRVMGLLAEKNAGSELKAMAVNFCYLTDQSISMQIATQIINIRNTFMAMQSKIESENFHGVEDIANTIHYITLCVSTILNRCCQDYTERSTQDILDNKKSDTSRVKETVEEISLIVFSKFFTKLIPLLRTDKGQIIVISLLKLIKALCPNNVPVEEYDDLWESLAKSLNELSMVASSKSKVQVVVLDTHLHFVDRILKSQRGNVLTPDAFKNGLTSSQIIVSSRPIDLKRNILTIRMLNRITALASTQNKKNHGDAIMSKVSKLLSEGSLLKLLDDLLSENSEDDNSVPCIQMSTCIIEILNVVSKSTKNPNVLIDSLEKEKTWFHISNCIVNGDEELVTQALGLLGAVGFSAKCRAGVARTVLEMRESCAASASSVVGAPERPQFPSFPAQMGMKRLNDNLEIFEQNHVEGSDQSIDDVLAWYKMKNDMHEMELSNMNDHIFHLNRTIAHLKTLLNKQAELVAKRSMATGTMQKSFNDLQQQLSVTKEKKIELEIKHFKAIEAIREQLVLQEKNYKKKCDRLEEVEGEFKRLKAASAEMEKKRDEAVQNAQKVSAEKRKLQEKLDEIEKEFKSSRQKLSSLETDLKKSEEARKTAESLLEAERRKTEIIQQVLGSRLN